MSETYPEKALWTFIDSYFQSVEQVEVLLLLFGDRSIEWTADEITKKFRSSVASIDARLRPLVANGLLSSRTNGQTFYRYEPRTEELHRLVAQLAEQYRVRRGRVIEAIYSSSTQKMFDLKNAFKVKQDDENG